MKGTYFGNGVYVTDRGVLHLEFKLPAASFGIQAARSFKESLEEAIAFAHQITRWPPIAVRAAKRVVQQNMQHDLDDALRNEVAHLAVARSATNDAREARAARAEGREPHFTGT